MRQSKLLKKFIDKSSTLYLGSYSNVITLGLRVFLSFLLSDNPFHYEAYKHIKILSPNSQTLIDARNTYHLYKVS